MFSFYTLGVMSGATDEVATGAEVSNTHFYRKSGFPVKCLSFFMFLLTVSIMVCIVYIYVYSICNIYVLLMYVFVNILLYFCIFYSFIVLC